jgi:starvation-inducible DNA-binding protein
MKKDKHKGSARLISEMNVLLAAYQVVYFNVRASHWMVKGENFFELHKVFETAYNDATTKIDEVAERILTLGGAPLLTASDMLAKSPVKERAPGGDETSCVRMLLEDLTQLTGIEKEIVHLADQMDDVVTADQLTGYMGEQQKTGWMLSQFLSRKSGIVK